MFAATILVAAVVGMCLACIRFSPDLVRPNKGLYRPGVWKSDQLGRLVITERNIYAWGRYAQLYA